MDCLPVNKTLAPPRPCFELWELHSGNYVPLYLMFGEISLESSLSSRDVPGIQRSPPALLGLPW